MSVRDVSLFATGPVLEPLLDEVAERQKAVLRSRPLHPRARGRGIRGGVRELPRGPPLRRRRQRHRGADDRAAGARGRPRRRGRRPRPHLLRDRRGGGQRRRHAGLLRRRPGDLRDDRGERRAGDRPADRGRCCRSTSTATRRRWTELRELASSQRPGAARGRRPGGRRQSRGQDGGCARRRRHLQLLPLQEPRRLRRRRRGRHRRRRGRRALARRLRFHGSEDSQSTPRSATTRASTSSRPPACGSCSPTWTSGPRRGAPPRPPTRGRPRRAR